MADKRIEQKRRRIRELLATIVDSYHQIDREMGKEKPSRGVVHRSLRPRPGDYICHSDEGISCVYTHSDGHSYSIQIHI